MVIKRLGFLSQQMPIKTGNTGCEGKLSTVIASLTKSVSYCLTQTGKPRKCFSLRCPKLPFGNLYVDVCVTATSSIILMYMLLGISWIKAGEQRADICLLTKKKTF